MFALTFQNKVVQIEAAQFPVHSALVWVNIRANPQGIVPGWDYDGVGFTAPPPPPPPPPPPTKPESIDRWLADPGNSAIVDEIAEVKSQSRAAVVARMKARP